MKEKRVAAQKVLHLFVVVQRVIRSDQYLRFGTHVIRGLIYEKKKKLCTCSVHSQHAHGERRNERI